MSAKKEIIIYAVIIIVGLILAQHMNVVISESMEPVFYRGDIVVVEKNNFLGIPEFDSNNAQIGDIVIYNAKWFPDGPVIHRIISEIYITDPDIERILFNKTHISLEYINGTQITGINPNGANVDGVFFNGTQGNETDTNGIKYFVIKGDHNPIADRYLVSPSQITQRVITIGDQPFIIPKIGYITIWLRGL